MLKELLESQKEFFSHYWQALNLEAASGFVQRLLQCQGSIVLTGVGKSGLIGQKIAMTLASTGTKSFFLCPVNALHGDIGQMGPQDLCILISKSGESEELLSLVPLLRQKAIPSVAWVSKENSRLSHSCDEAIFLPVAKELCPFDLVPTTSAAVQLLFGDLIAIALLKLRNFTLDDYARNHPSGRIGRRLLLQVKDLMIKNEKLPLCSPKQLLVDTLVELSNKQCGCVLVADPGKQLLGLFTDGDLRRSLLHYGSEVLERSMEELMTKTPRTMASSALAWDALQEMERDPQKLINVLPVVDADRKIEGLIKMHDLIQAGL
jgi:arabinose-5-phosphate isomerase